MGLALVKNPLGVFARNFATEAILKKHMTFCKLSLSSVITVWSVLQTIKFAGQAAFSRSIKVHTKKFLRNFLSDHL